MPVASILKKHLINGLLVFSSVCVGYLAHRLRGGSESLQEVLPPSKDLKYDREVGSNDRVLRLSESSSIGEVYKYLSSEHAPNNPEEFLEYYSTNIEPLPRRLQSIAIDAIFAEFAQENLASAIECVKVIPSDDLRGRAMEVIASNCAINEDNVKTVIEMSSSRERKLRLWANMVGSIKASSPKEHFKEAVELSKQIGELLPQAVSQEIISIGVAEAWVSKDPKAAWRLGLGVEGLLGVTLRKLSIRSIIESNPEVARELLNTAVIGTFNEKQYYRGELIKSVFKFDLPEAANLLTDGSLKDSSMMSQVKKGMDKWSVRQLKEFFELAPELTKNAEFGPYMIKAALGSGLEMETFLKNGGLSGVGKLPLQTLSETEQPDARALAAILGAEGARQHFENDFENAAWKSLSKQDVSLALETAGKIEDPKAKAVALKSIISEVASNDPQKAIEIMGNGSLTLDLRNSLLPNLLVSWSQKDPSRALDWVKSTQVGKERVDCIAAIANSTSDLSEGLLSEISIGLDAGPNAISKQVADNLAKETSLKIAGTSPQNALNWALSIKDEKVSKIARDQAYSVWAATDLNSYSNWLSTSGVESRDYDDAVKLLVRRIPDDVSLSMAWASSVRDQKVRSVLMKDVFTSGQKSYGEEIWSHVPENLRHEIRTLIKN